MTSYEERRPWTVPETLDELTGPVHGTVHLPPHLDWSEQRYYNLDDPADLGVLYERVIRESAEPADLRRFLNAVTLQSVWRSIFLPQIVRRLWEEQFSDLRPAD